MKKRRYAAHDELAGRGVVSLTRGDCDTVIDWYVHPNRNNTQYAMRRIARLLNEDEKKKAAARP